MKNTTFNKPKSLKFIISTLAIVFVAILAISIYFIIENGQKTVSIRFMVAPSSADISLNGTKYDNQKEIKIKPGEYNLEIKKDGYFEPYTETITLSDNETKEYYIELVPIEGTDWYAEHPDDAAIMDAIISHELNEYDERIGEKYPIINDLPIEIGYYSGSYIYYVISYEINADEELTILIKDYTGDNYERALERIRITGYNPDDYTIKYLDETDNF